VSRPYAGYGVAGIIDLRYPDEGLPRAGQLPAHPFADDPNVYRSIPMYDPAVVDVDPELLATGAPAEIYCASADHNGVRIANAVTAIASAPPGPGVVHCVAGNDRTGIVVALAHAVAGVGNEAIADCAASAGHLASRFADELARESDAHASRTP